MAKPEKPRLPGGKKPLGKPFPAPTVAVGYAEDEDTVDFEVSVHTILLSQLGVVPDPPPVKRGKRLKVTVTFSPAGATVGVSVGCFDGGGGALPMTFGTPTISGNTWAATTTTNVAATAVRGQVSATASFGLLTSTAYMAFTVI